MAMMNDLHVFKVGRASIGVSVDALFKTDGDEQIASCTIGEDGVLYDVPTDVTAFQVGVQHESSARVFITQRGKRNLYRGSRKQLLGDKTDGEIASYTFPPCPISWHRRSSAELSFFNGRKECRAVSEGAVWLTPMSKSNKGPNRFDVIYVGTDGAIIIFVIYLVTLDDGATWQFIGQERWTGEVCLRTEQQPYQLRTTEKDDKRVFDFFRLNEDAQRMFNKYVFVPGEHAEHFEKRCQILQHREICGLIDSVNQIVPWTGPTDFWFNREPKVDLRPGQGVVRFLTHGVGRGSFGIVTYQGRDYQFDHHAIVGQLLDDGEQPGAIFMPSGTVVDMEIDGDKVVAVESFGAAEGALPQRFHPPKVRMIIPQMMPVPIEYRSIEPVI